MFSQGWSISATPLLPGEGRKWGVSSTQALSDLKTDRHGPRPAPPLFHEKETARFDGKGINHGPRYRGLSVVLGEPSFHGFPSEENC